MNNTERKCCDSCVDFCNGFCGYSGDYAYGGDLPCSAYRPKNDVKTKSDLQDFDKAALAEFGCRMCNNARNAHRRSHGIKPTPCPWRNENFSAAECFNCDSLKLALEDFFEETR